MGGMEFQGIDQLKEEERQIERRELLAAENEALKEEERRTLLAAENKEEVHGAD